ncbi:hypothetical protein IAR55_005930 [Kwoniella newhampshirensis]|uniref:Uncharacterized protein n=1 Tax=Kwoniella newhampshirensis TaxID=1651941 RepID=A0AAW0YVU2_9TREE
MFVHLTPPLPPGPPFIHHRSFPSHHRSIFNTHSRSPLAPPNHIRRTSSLRDPPPGASGSPSPAASEPEEDEFMAHQTRSAGRRRIGRRKDERG